MKNFKHIKNLYYYSTSIGEIGIADNGEAITGVYFAGENDLQYDEGVHINETGLIREAAAQLMDYLDGKRRAFEVPIAMNGTEFQQAVWNALREIPYGETRSYRQIAERIGRPKACRAVGMANNRNPVAVIVPCHRVIGADGSLVGYGGGLDTKVRLLNLEKQYASGCSNG